MYSIPPPKQLFLVGRCDDHQEVGYFDLRGQVFRSSLDNGRHRSRRLVNEMGQAYTAPFAFGQEK